MPGGGLFTALANLYTVEPDANGYSSINPFPYEIPAVVMDPATGFPLL
jgi:hypothetical protein